LRVRGRTGGSLARKRALDVRRSVRLLGGVVLDTGRGRGAVRSPAVGLCGLRWVRGRVRARLDGIRSGARRVGRWERVGVRRSVDGRALSVVSRRLGVCVGGDLGARVVACDRRGSGICDCLGGRGGVGARDTSLVGGCRGGALLTGRFLGRVRRNSLVVGGRGLVGNSLDGGYRLGCQAVGLVSFRVADLGCVWNRLGVGDWRRFRNASCCRRAC